MTERPLQLGLIGAGRWGRNYIKTLRALEKVRLARLASTNPESRNLVDGDCIISKDWCDVVGAQDLDGVIIATPPATHAQIAAAAITRNLAVLVEKPLTMDLAQARHLLDLGQAKGALVMVNHIYLYHPAYVQLKAMAAGLGPVRSICANTGNWGPFRQEAPVLWDWGSHDVAMCLDLLGETPVTAAAQIREKREVEGRTGECVHITLGFESGVCATIAVSNLMETKHRRFEVRFDQDSLIFDDTSDHKLTHLRTGKEEGIPVPTDDTPPLMCVVDAFATAIRGKRADIAGLRLGAQTVETLARCQESLDAP